MTEEQTKFILQLLPHSIEGGTCDCSNVADAISKVYKVVSCEEIRQLVEAYCNANGIKEREPAGIFSGSTPPDQAKEGSLWLDLTTPGIARVLVGGQWLIV